MPDEPTESAEVSLELVGAPRVAYRVIRALLRGVMKTAFRLDVVGREHVPSSGAFVLAPGGHRSILDTPTVALAGPRVLRYMGAESYFHTPVLGWFLRAMGGFPVERSTTDRNALRLAEWILANGEPLAVFPESTRQEGPIVQPLKEGAAFLACRAQVPILPVGIGGAERALPIGRYLPRPRKITMVIGEPLHPPARAPGERVKRSEVTRLTEKLRDTLQALFDEAQIRAGS